MRSSIKIQHTVQINCFSDVDLILWLGHVVEQKFQNHRTAEAAALDFEVGEAHRKIAALNSVDADERGIRHRLRETVALTAVECYTNMVGTGFAKTLAADVFVAGFAVIAAEPTTLVAEKFHFV